MASYRLRQLKLTHEERRGLARLTIEQVAGRPARMSASKDQVTLSILASDDEMPMLGDLVWEALTEAGFKVVDPAAIPAIPIDEGFSVHFTVKVTP